MAKTTKAKQVDTVSIEKLKVGTTLMHVLGTTPLMMNRMTAKARQHLLWPPPAMNKAAREAKMKHDPPAEFNDSIYRCRDPKAPTLVHLPNGAFKKAMAQAAIDIPGATKAQIGRLVSILDETVYVYGKPMLSMMNVRQGGINKTPDIRTRAIFVRWACRIEVRFVRSGGIREQDIINLMDAAGMICGVGDGRTEKGTFNFGSWEIVEANDKRWLQVVREGGRKVQVAAMAKPECHDADSEELLSWFQKELLTREREKAKVIPLPTARKNGRRRAA